MSRAPRTKFAGAYYHIFNRGVAKRPIVLDDRDRKTFLEILGKTVPSYQVRLFAYCLMGNHYHLFLQTLLPNVDRFVQQLQGQYGHYFNLRYERVGALFQGRYRDRLVDVDSYALALIRYIHQNPQRAHITRSPEDYPWSSFLSYIGKLPRWKWLDCDWILSQFGRNFDEQLKSFVRFHNELPSEEELQDLERKKGVLTRGVSARQFCKGV